MLGSRSLGFVSRSVRTVRTFSTTPQRSGDVARVTLVGRLGANPEHQTTPTGREVISYRIGTSFGQGENKKTSWFSVGCFDERQKDYTASLTKGSLVYVEGDITHTVYETEDGQKKTRINIYQRSICALYKKSVSPGEGVEGSDGTVVGGGDEGQQVV